MNKDWSEKCKSALELISKEATFDKGIKELLELREILFTEITRIYNEYPAEAFAKQPFVNAKGLHNKTLSYSIWHVFRIEDIVCHTLILNDTQVLFTGDWQKKIGSPIITTGNEVLGSDIAEFSKKLNVTELYNYAKSVKESTDDFLRKVDFKSTKIKVSAERRAAVESSGCVSKDENAWWLIDYWCGKTTNGLMKMPFSRHWIMHIEAMNRILAKV